jgi:hypothetical protein
MGKFGVIAAHAKDFSSFAFPTPLHVVGRFSNLSFDLGDSERGEQTATETRKGVYWQLKYLLK